MPSSREASEEPEYIAPVSRASTAMTTTPEKSLVRSATAADSPNDEKKKRRFSLSSPFHRSSRSRSRPNSIILPSNSSSLFGSGTPRGTPPRELSRILGDESSRPHSYHAPDSWTFAPGLCPPASNSQFDTTPPRNTSQPQSRLGILPSPAKSAFSSQEHDIEQDIPPVPPLPETMGDVQQQYRTSQDDAAHKMLQSVIRNSTPVSSIDVGKLVESVECDEANTKGGAVSSVKARPSDLEGAMSIPEDTLNLERQHEPMSDNPTQIDESDHQLVQSSLKSMPGASPPAAQSLDRTDVDEDTIEALTSLNQCHHDEDGNNGLPQLRRSPSPVAAGSLPQLQHLPSNGDEHRTLQVNENLSPAVVATTSPNATVHAEKSSPVMSSIKISDDNDDDDDDDDDDKPPQLNHDPIPAATGPQLQDLLPAIAFIDSSQLDVSDDEDDGPPHASRTSMLQAPNTGLLTGDVSPLLKPVELSIDHVRDEDYAEHFPEDGTSVTDASHQHRGDQDTLDFENFAANQGNKRPLSELDFVESGVKTPTFPQGKSDEPVNQPQDKKLAVDPSDGNLCENVESTVKRPSFETELIGGDVSPISTASHGVEDEDATPKAEVPRSARWFAKDHHLQFPKVRAQGAESFTENPTVITSLNLPEQKDVVSNSFHPSPRQIGEIAVEGQLPEATRDSSLSPDHTLPPQLHVANTEADTLTHRVSATPFQVVHAVEYAASSSSLTSWDHDSIAANSHYESSQPDEMKDESDLVTPVAQVPRITQHGPQADKAEEPYDKTSSMAMQNGYFRGQTNFPEPIHQSQQLHTSKSDMTVPERSKSLLSQISAMVSEGGNPISPASSVAGRSTPSTIRRMQRDSSTKNPLTPAQIPEEPTTAWSDHTPTAKDDDFDLYADHNGIVKDIRDKSGQPLRVASPQTSDSAQHSHAMKSTAAPAGAVPTPKDEDRPRYSTERPMSFISGPPDSDGKPQDQINQFAPPSDTQVPPVPEQYRKPPQQAGALPVDTSYSGDPSISLAQPQHQGPPLQQSSQESVAASNKVQNTSHVEQNAAAHGQVISNPSQESTPPPRVAEGSSVNQQVPQNGQVLYHGLKGRPVYETTPPPSVPQGTPVQGQPLAPDHDPRVQGQPLGPPLGPPRNQYEYHQQMMQLQSKAPQFRSAENQVPPTFVHQPSTQVPKPQEKHSSKPRLSSVFKSLGGKSHAAQPPSAPSTAMHSSLKPLPADPHRNGSFHSAVSSLSLSHEPSAGRHGEQLGSYPTANRPPSMGAESHFSQISQGSTRVQPTDSRIDLRKPASPAPFQGIPPQHPPLAASVPNGQPQPHRAPTSGVVETGKKKRFSTLGGLFGRSATASDGPPTKNKLSKEDKKALKAQRNSTAPPMQAPAQQWPPQQQQFRPQQPGMVYPPGHNPPQSMQAMRPMGPQYASPQTMSPMSPQVLQGTQGMPSQRVFQQYPGPQQGPPPLQPMVGNRPEQGSAFLRTKQLAEEHQAQQKLARLSLQGSHLGPQASSTSFDQLPPQLRQPSWDAPPGGYYKPDTKPPIADQGSYAASQAARQQVLQQRQESIREEGAYAASQAERLQLQQRQQSMHEQAPYSTSHNERLAAQQRQRPGSEQGAYAGSQAERLQAPPLRQQLAQEQGAYRAPHTEQQQILLQQQGMTDQMAYEASLAQRQQAERQQAERQQIERQHVERQHVERQHVERQHVERQHVERQHVERQQAERQLLERQQAERQRQRPVPGHGGYGISHDERLHIQQQHQFHPQHQSSNAQPPLNHRSVSGPPPHHALHTHPTVPQRHVSSPLTEPQYEAPPIPAAYSHVSGAFISPRDQQQQPLFSPANESVARPSIDQYGRQFSDPRMPSISPQVSVQSQMPPNNRTHSDASTASVVSPISNSPDIPTASPPPGQRPQKPRMSSISEVRQQERPWHMNFPEGATEQEIVRARQRQYMEAQFTAQQQLHAERSAQSPSPRAPSHEQTPVHDAAPLPQAPMHGGGFKELLPRSSPQPFTVSQPAQPSQEEPQRVADSPHSQPAHIHPDQAPPPAALPLPMSPDSSDPRSPVNPLAGTLPPPPPPPKVPHSPMRPMFPPSNSPPKEEQQQQHIAPTLQQYETPPPPGQQYSPPPPSHEPQYEQSVPDEPPPSYDGPGVPNDGMDKSRSERRPRPPNITTDTEYAGRGRQQDPRQRQPSLGILQHPQPASMAASPQRSSADMGAESLRRQLLQQEEQARMERIQRAQIQRAESDRERHERDMARARARELERSASGGGRVGSLRSVAGSRNGGTPGWERRGSTTRPVFELPAVEDDEPSMKATSYPGQEWVPPMWTDD
ncbi:hypothetical protein BKA66DRAFT_564408 [Pyrenochaeta sp. MPI-SDFR-AT-0127]|nr:hypothetical protein BKA66DRAFT_564408 [Pyrenochaeta sp. MPI-SDFR-AT-0127]